MDTDFDEDPNSTTLSRLNADFFTKNLHYACNYWLEHDQNFKDVIQTLMEQETIEKVANSSAAMVMTFNHKIGWIPAEYNLEEIHTAYTNFVEEVKLDKMFLYRLANVYFRAFIAQMDSFDPKLIVPRNRQDPANSIELVNIKKVFSNPKFNDSEIEPYAQKLLGEKYNRENAKKYLYPQLILYLLRFLDIYDKSMEGNTVEEFIIQKQNPKPSPQSKKEKLMQKLGEEILKSFGVKEFWEARYSTFNPNSQNYDWYTTWSDLSKIVYTHVGILKAFKQKKDEGKSPASPLVLHMGCGNSSLSEDLHSDGITNVHGIDFCSRVIDVMNTKKERLKKDELRYTTMDARGLRYEDKMFDIVIDKGCLDCMVCTPKDSESMEFLDRAIREVARVLKVGGWYVLLSCGINAERFARFGVEKYKWKIVHTALIEAKQGLNFDINVIIVRREGEVKDD